MKLLFAALFSLLTTISALGQAFEGRIMYSNSYKSKLPNVTDQQWTDMLGTTQEYSLKGGDYKSVANGKLMQWQLFRNQDSKLYTKMSNSEAALWIDSSINTDEVIKAEVKKGVSNVLGYKCDEVTLTCKSGVQKYYFNAKIGVDSKLYVNHKYGNWYDYLKNANALSLKMVIDTPQFLMESVAVEVKPMKLDTKLFQLPTDIKTEKSPY